MRPLSGLLNINITWVGNPEPMGVKHTCNKYGYKSVLVSKYFFIVHFTSFAYASACPLLWWLYDDMAWWIFRHLQNSQNFSEIWSVPVEDIIFFKSSYSASIILHYSEVKLCSLWTEWNCVKDKHSLFLQHGFISFYYILLVLLKTELNFISKTSCYHVKSNMASSGLKKNVILTKYTYQNMCKDGGRHWSHGGMAPLGE